MKTVKKLGIWMDHSIAYLMEFTTSPFEIQTIESKIPAVDKNSLVAKNSKKEKKTLFNYYNTLSNAIKNYKQVILFGPTDAKMEFFDVLSEDVRFHKMKVEIKETDKMNARQQHEFIREHFANK
jgi:stalled ribosome rescue protein Dom34